MLKNCVPFGFLPTRLEVETKPMVRVHGVFQPARACRVNGHQPAARRAERSQPPVEGNRGRRRYGMVNDP